MAEFLELLDALRATRDADSCLRGLNLFRKGLRGEDGPVFLARYLKQSPEWQELQSVWDTQLTVQHYHVTVTLLLALADALRTATAGAANCALEAATRATLAAGGAGLAASVLHRRLKALYFCLSSDMRGKANAALALLSAVVAALAPGSDAGTPPAAAGSTATPAASLRDLVRAFDWSLSALPGLARPPREKKGEGAAELRRRYWQQWALGDPLKRPTRALFSELALGLLRHAGGDALLTQQLLQLRQPAGGLLHHLAADPPTQQLEVLHVLQRRVLSPKAAVPAAVQAEVFSDAALQQLAVIAATAAVEGQEEGAEEPSAPGEGGEQQARQAAAAALAILEALATQPAHGLAAAADGPGQRQFVLADAGSHQLQPGQRRLLRLLLRLRPADSAAHLQLLLEAAANDAALAAALLLALPYSLEPAAVGAAAAGSAAAGRWFAHAAVAARLLQLLPAAAPSGLLQRGPAPPPGGRRSQALLRCCFPPCLQRAALSRGLQHTNSLVRHGTLGLLVSAMSVLEAVLQECTAAADAAGSAQGGQALDAREGWLALRRWLQQAARQQLPDPTLLLALLSAAEKEGWDAANELQLTAVLRLLLLWQRLLPSALTEANVDADRLLPAQPLALQPQHQLLLLELLQAAAEAPCEAAASAGDEAAAPAAAAAPAVASAAALLPPLRLLVGARHVAVRGAARRLLLQRLLATAAFAGNGEEAVLWLDLLPGGGEVACSFLVEALQMLLRRPHELFEQQQQLLAAAAAACGSGAASQLTHALHGQPQFSLLAPCALRQLLRVLGSAKMPGADKAAVAAYVAAVLRQLLEQQLGSGEGDSSGAALAAVLLGIARQEAARQHQQEASRAGGEQSGKEKSKEKKRKAPDEGANGSTTGTLGAPLVLPAEGEPLLGLLAALERQLSPEAAPAGRDGSGEQPAKKAKKRSGHPAVGEAGGTADSGCTVAAPSGGGPGPGGEPQLGAADACCLLISSLAGSAAGAAAGGGAAEALAAIQRHVCSDLEVSARGAGASAARSMHSSSGTALGVGTSSAAVRQCLHLLGQPDMAASAPALLQVLRATVLGAGSAAEQRRCLQLLAGSALVSSALSSTASASSGSAAQQALASTVVQLLAQVMQSASADDSTAACCAPLIEQVAACFLRLASSKEQGGSSGSSGGGMPEAAAAFLLLLRCMPLAAAAAATDVLLGRLASDTDGEPGSSGSGSGINGGKKQKKKGAAAAEAGGQSALWLHAAAAAVVQQVAASYGLQQHQLEQGCAALPRLAAAGAPAVFDCLLCLLAGQHGTAALAKLGTDGQLRLLRCCLQPSAAGSLAARSQLAALLVRSGCLTAAGELQALLSNGSRAALALALPAAAALLEQQPEAAVNGGADQDALCSPVAAALGHALAAYFTSGDKRGSDGDSGASKGKAKKAKSAGVSAADSATGGRADSAEVAQLLQRHALPCLALALRRQLLDGEQRQRLLAALLPQEGWPVLPAAGNGPGTAELAEAAVMLATAAGSSSSRGAGVRHLAACVRCFAATLASLMRLPAGEQPLEARLMALLDGQLGDAVAALPSAQRGSAAFADLAAATAGTLGTAVLRHRLAAASAEADDGRAAAAAAAAAGVAAMRVLRRFMAALLPEEEEEAAEGAGGDGSGNGERRSGESDDESNSSSRSESDGDRPMPDQPAGVHNPAVADAAVQLLQRLLGHSRFLPAMRAATASPPPLPPAAEAAPRPLASLLPLAAAAGSPAVPADAALAADMKKELCELIETLLDLHQQYSGASSAATQQAQQVAAAEAALLPLLMAGYGASCSSTDAAVWSLAASINQRQWQREQQDLQAQGRVDAGAAAAAELAAEGGADVAALTALLHGPLARSSFAWGPAAAALQQLPPVHAGEGGDADEAQRTQRRQLLQQRLPLDSLRAALTVCHWPEACSLAAPGSSSQPGGGGGGSSSSGGPVAQPAQLPGCAAAYDPAFLLPFCCCCLRQQLLAPRVFAEAGLVSVCLRGLAAADPACRAAAYQALALFEAQLTAAAAPDFREKQQLSVLLSTLRATITRPFQRLPAVHAAFLAEAALLALHPGAAMYPAVNKQITRRATLAASEVPLLGQLLMSGGQQHAAERRWMLQLLLAGLRGSDDASLYRRKHAFEQAMALHDSAVADPAVASLALRLLCTATYVPRAARQLARESGLIPWLAGAAQAALERLAQQGGGSDSAGGTQGAAGDAEQALQAPLQALRRLLQLRAVMRGAGGAGVAQHMLAAARQLASAAAATAGLESGAPGASCVASVCRHVLPFLQEARQQLGGSSSGEGPSGSKRLPGGAQGVEDVAAAVQALAAAAEAST